MMHAVGVVARVRQSAGKREWWRESAGNVNSYILAIYGFRFLLSSAQP